MTSRSRIRQGSLRVTAGSLCSPRLDVSSPRRPRPRGARRARVRCWRSSSARAGRRPTRRSTSTSTRSASSADVASSWTPTGDLGHVQGGQYGGYLFPMGPFFALGDLARAPPVARRTGCGSARCSRSPRGATVRLLDALLGRPRGVAHARRRAADRCSTRTSSCSPTARPSRCSATRRCRGCCSPSTAACARRAAGGGPRRSRSSLTLHRRRRQRRGDRLAARSARCCSSPTSAGDRRGVVARACALRAGGRRC